MQAVNQWEKIHYGYTILRNERKYKTHFLADDENSERKLLCNSKWGHVNPDEFELRHTIKEQ